MAKNIDLTSQEWIDLIFEVRNKSYGAYTLRQQSSKRHLLAFLITLGFTVITFFGITLVKKVNETMLKDENKTVVELIDLDKPAPPPDEIIEHKVEAPPPVDIAKTIKYQVPRIEKDELVNDEQEIKAVSDVLDDKEAIISIVDNEKGRTDGLGVDPADLEQNKIIVNEPVEDNKIWEGIVEQLPSFPGGESAMYEWLGKNIVYPVIAIENRIQGRVTLQFVVEKNGEIGDIKVLRGVDASIDKEALRVVKSMPKWIPGRQGGTPVRVRYTLPVQFKLQ